MTLANVKGGDLPLNNVLRYLIARGVMLLFIVTTNFVRQDVMVHFEVININFE